MVDFNTAIELIRQNGGFKPNKREDSYYRTYKTPGNRLQQARISNHGTHLWTWYDRDYDPSYAINTCIVFSESGTHDSDVSVDMNIKDKQGNVIGQRKTMEVIQYVYNCQLLDENDTALINKEVQSIWQNNGFKDPLAGTPKHAKVFKLNPNQSIQTITENKQYNKNRNMKRTIKLRESDLRRMIAESVKGVINELDWKTYANAARKRAEQGASDYDIYQLDQAANNALYDKYKITGDTHFPFAPQIQTSKGEYTWERDEDGNYSKKYPHAGQIGRYPQLGYQGDFNDTYYTPIGDNLNDEPYQMTTYDNFPMHKERHKDMSNYFSGKSKYVKGKGWQNESISRKINRIVSECIKRNLR